MNHWIFIPCSANSIRVERICRLTVSPEISSLKEISLKTGGITVRWNDLAIIMEHLARWRK